MHARPPLFSLLVPWLLLPALAAAGTPLVDAARAQIGVTVVYDGAYRRLAYPGGDIEPERGVCTDVIVRAYRRLGVDLQKLVHEDMQAAWSAYPHSWGLAHPDPNIDHRRVPNLATFFTRHGQALAASADRLTYRAGDIVTWRLPSGVPHIGLVADQQAPDGTPLVIHNIGAGAKMEDSLFAFPVTGHFRYEMRPQSGARAHHNEVPTVGRR